MKKVFLVLFLLFIFFIFNKEEENILRIDGVKYAVSINGEPMTSFPEKGSYNVELTCEGATGVWNYEKWLAELSEISNDATCNISFTNKTQVNMSDYIIGLLNGGNSISSEAKTGNGSTLEKITENGEEDYRYRGINPANYIKFNNELWRIIGVFDENTHGITGKKLVKLIRNNSIGGYNWDNDRVNNFPYSDIHSLLNTSYYNATNSTNESYCYNYQQTQKAKCNFTKIGIQSEYRNMIDSSVNWFLGGVTVSLGTSSELYNSERNSANVYDGHAFTTNSVGVTTSIALMYASDYGYAAPASCVNGIGDYDSIDNCKGNWLNSNSKYKEWLLTVLYTDEAYVLLKHTSGQVDNSGSYYGYAIRPVLYLKEDVYHLSGDGTPTNPYVIGM